MPYELFENKATKFGPPQLTISGGRIALNAAAGDILTAAGMRFAHLLWDAHARKIAIRPVAKQDSTSFKVTVFRGKRGRQVSARSFLNHIHWKSDGPVAVAAQWNGKERILEASLPAGNIESVDDMIKRNLG